MVSKRKSSRKSSKKSSRKSLKKSSRKSSRKIKRFFGRSANYSLICDECRNMTTNIYTCINTNCGFNHFTYCRNCARKLQYKCNGCRREMIEENIYLK